MIRALLAKHRHKRACQKLAQHVEDNRRAPATREYVRKREAMMKVTRA